MADKLASSRHLRWPQLMVAYAAGSFGFGFQNMVQFLVPLRAQELGVPLEFIGVLVGAGALVPALLSVTSGELVDRFGARQAYVGGTLVCVARALLFRARHGVYRAVVIQLVMGFARSTAWIASQGYVSHLGTGAERATHMGRLSFASSAGTLVAPLVIGAAAQVLGYQDAFFVAAGLASLYVVMGLFARCQSRAPTDGARFRRLRNGAELAEEPRHPGRADAHLQPAVGRIGLAAVLSDLSCQPWLCAGPDRHRPGGQLRGLDGGDARGGPSVVASTRLCDCRRARARRAWHGALAVRCSVPSRVPPALLTGTAAGLSLPLLMATVSTEAPPDQRGVALGLRMSANQAASTTAPIVVGSLVSGFGIVVGFARQRRLLLDDSRRRRRAPRSNAGWASGKPWVA